MCARQELSLLYDVPLRPSGEGGGWKSVWESGASICLRSPEIFQSPDLSINFPVSNGSVLRTRGLYLMWKSERGK